MIDRIVAIDYYETKKCLSLEYNEMGCYLSGWGEFFKSFFKAHYQDTVPELNSCFALLPRLTSQCLGGWQ